MSTCISAQTSCKGHSYCCHLNTSPLFSIYFNIKHLAPSVRRRDFRLTVIPSKDSFLNIFKQGNHLTNTISVKCGYTRLGKCGLLVSVPIGSEWNTIGFERILTQLGATAWGNDIWNTKMGRTSPQSTRSSTRNFLTSHYSLWLSPRTRYILQTLLVFRDDVDTWC